MLVCDEWLTRLEILKYHNLMIVTRLRGFPRFCSVTQLRGCYNLTNCTLCTPQLCEEGEIRGGCKRRGNVGQQSKCACESYPGSARAERATGYLSSSHNLSLIHILTLTRLVSFCASPTSVQNTQLYQLSLELPLSLLEQKAPQQRSIENFSISVCANGCLPLDVRQPLPSQKGLNHFRLGASKDLSCTTLGIKPFMNRSSTSVYTPVLPHMSNYPQRRNCAFFEGTQALCDYMPRNEI